MYNLTIIKEYFLSHRIANQMKRALKTARKALDNRLSVFGQGPDLVPPPKGWIRAIRNAIGMSTSQLARRMKITPQSVNGLEKSEANETIRLETLRKVATALNCRLVYALVPDVPLGEMVNKRARAIVVEAIRGIDHSMALEGQEVPDDDREDRIQELMSESLRDRHLWQDL